jgi:hypothetical protein
MRSFSLLAGLFVLLSAGIAAGGVAMNAFYPSDPGTPAHAGAVSQGRPEECTNLAVNVKPRAESRRAVLLEEGNLLRGTFEADGGLGRVDIFLRVVDPQGLDILASPRAQSYDFTFPAKIRGEYVFVLDNRFSLYTAKSVGLFYCIDDGSRPYGG